MSLEVGRGQNPGPAVPVPGSPRRRGTLKRMKMSTFGGDAAYSAVVAYGYEGWMRRPYVNDRLRQR